MSEKFKRKLFFYTNKFQRTLFYPVIAAFLIGCLTSWVTLFCFYFLDAPAWNEKIFGFVPLLLTILFLLMFLVLIWTFHTSNKIVGPYNRIIKELDQILSGERKTSLTARKGDKMFQELLARINELIAKKGD